MSDNLDRQAFREWARAVFGDRSAQFEKLVDRVLGGKRPARRQVRCPKCSHGWRAEFAVGDDKLALELFRLLSEAGFGRPGTEQAVEGPGTFEFVNEIYLQCDMEDCPHFAGECPADGCENNPKETQE